jgi:GT2 family glycosyltransferase
MNKSYKASVIISVYSNDEALRAVLDSLKLQTEKDFEIIISEDAMHEHMREFCANYPFENDYQHLTQPDVGWRKNVALNNAIRASHSDWLIFIDGDSVVHPRFVEQHLKLSSPKGIVAGKRVKLDAEQSKWFLEGDNYKKIQGRLWRNLFRGRKAGFEFVEEGLFINPNSVFGWIPRLRGMSNLRGCNMSFSKSAIEAINGFDEEYILPAVGEDADLVWRFQAAGYHLVSARNRAVQYHLYHKENWVEQSENLAIMERKMQNNEYICAQGLVKRL